MVAGRRLLQVLFEEIQDAGVHVGGVVAFLEEMIVVRIELHLKLFVRPHKCVDILHRVLYVHVVVTRSLNDQHLTSQIFGNRQQRSFSVSAVIHLRTAHIRH